MESNTVERAMKTKIDTRTATSNKVRAGVYRFQRRKWSIELSYGQHAWTTAALLMTKLSNRLRTGVRNDDSTHNQSWKDYQVFCCEGLEEEDLPYAVLSLGRYYLEPRS